MIDSPYQSVADRQEPLRMRLKELAGKRVGFGYRRLHVMLRREGWQINHKRVYRLYREECLGLRKKPPRRRVASVKRGYVLRHESRMNAGAWILYRISSLTDAN
ncbi:MAG: transposase [Ignavibacteriae bacterium]|nr:transposase [Ignavibacteria bacterium]MBI3365003.1 transposase [Ignavibacteriota bacterium]